MQSVKMKGCMGGCVCLPLVVEQLSATGKFIVNLVARQVATFFFPNPS